ncbi:MAG: hypothetical protein QM808_03090 [Steroidobacteraceae bacterium]
MLDEWRWRNIVISALIVASHILLLRIQWLPQVKLKNDVETMFLRLLSLPEPIFEVVKETTVPIKPEQSLRSASSSTTLILSTESSPLSTSSGSASSNGVAITELPESPAAIDWREASENVAAEMARRAAKETYRSLDSRPASEAQWTKDREARLRYQPQDFTGETWHFEGGETITWINSRCYITNRPVYSASDPLRKTSPPVCKTPPKNTPRGDLFKDLKPNYLRIPVEDLPYPKAKAP